MGQHPATTQSQGANLLQAHISIEPGIWSSGPSTRSSTVDASQRATTNSRPIISRSSSLRLYAVGRAPMSPRPSHLGARAKMSFCAIWCAKTRVDRAPDVK